MPIHHINFIWHNGHPTPKQTTFLEFYILPLDVHVHQFHIDHDLLSIMQNSIHIIVVHQSSQFHQKTKMVRVCRIPRIQFSLCAPDQIALSVTHRDVDLLWILLPFKFPNLRRRRRPSVKSAQTKNFNFQHQIFNPLCHNPMWPLNKNIYHFINHLATQFNFAHHLCIIKMGL